MTPLQKPFQILSISHQFKFILPVALIKSSRMFTSGDKCSNFCWNVTIICQKRGFKKIAFMQYVSITINYNNWPNQHSYSLPSLSIFVIPHFPSTRFFHTVLTPIPRGVTKPSKETILLRRDYLSRWLLLRVENQRTPEKSLWVEWLSRTTGNKANKLNTTKNHFESMNPTEDALKKGSALITPPTLLEQRTWENETKFRVR